MDHQVDEELGEKFSSGSMMEVKKTRKRKPDIEINMNANPFMRSCNSSMDGNQERNLQEENNHKSETAVANGINLDDFFSQFAFKGDVARPRGNSGKHWRESVKSCALSSHLWNGVKKLGRTEESESLTIKPAFPRLSQEKIHQTCYEVETDILEKGTADQNLKKKVDAESRVDPNDFQAPLMQPKGKDDRMDPIIKKNNKAHEEACFISSSIQTSMGQPAVVDDRKDMKIKLSKVQKLKKKRNKNAHAEVRVVSPYFQIPVGQPVVVARKRDSKIKLTRGQEQKEEDAEVRVVSPYFEIPVGQPVVVLGDRRDSKARLPKGQKLNKKKQELQLVSPFLQIPMGQPALTDGRKSSTAKSPKPRRKSRPKVLVVSPYFHPTPKEEVNMTDGEVRRAKKPLVIKRYLSASQKRDEAYLRKTSDNTWVPPRSPFGLLQEDHAHDPWRVLVICMLLNCTTGVQVKRVIEDFFALCPDAEAATITPAKEILKVIETLGLHRKRAVMIRRLSKEYLGESWTHVTQLHGVGKYAADAYAIFCTGAWRGLVPLDHMLDKYFQFLESSMGRGRRRFC